VAEQFPRSIDLPSQSPLFWVEQKDRYLRQLLIRDIEALTKRRLVVYFGNRFENAMIDGRDPTFMAELLGDVGEAPVDLMLEVTGGVTDATEAIIALIQHQVKDFRAIVPHSAKSNGTLLCLAAKSIVMGAPSELGPIEPAINGIPCTILSDDAMKNMNFVLHKQGVFALQQSKTIAKSLLAAGMMAGKTPAEIDEITNKLSTRETYASHGSVIHHREAVTLGLKIEYLPPEDPVWERLWLLYCMYESDCRKNRYLKVFEGRARSTAVAAPAPAPAVPAKS
jgi:Serine dehydrogenase proteinase